MLAHTGADAVMIGRAAQGRPWIFREIAHYLATGATLPPPTVDEARLAMLEHLDDHYAFYGEELGVRIARKHLGWYTGQLAGRERFRHAINAVESVAGAACGGRAILRAARDARRAAALPRRGTARPA